MVIVVYCWHILVKVLEREIPLLLQNEIRAVKLITHIFCEYKHKYELLSFRALNCLMLLYYGIAMYVTLLH